jgi:hypothetical protein
MEKGVPVEVMVQLANQLRADPWFNMPHQATEANGGSLLVYYQDVSKPSKYGSFGALEYLGQERTPKWQSILAFNSSGCWWEGC